MATVPIQAAVAPTQLQQLSAVTQQAAVQQQILGAETAKTTTRITDQQRAAAQHAQRLRQATTGAAATALTMSGLRGAAIGASGAFLGAAVAVTAFSKAIRGAAGLESELNVFRITAQATGDEMERVAEEARRLGADIRLPAVSSGDAAQAMTELARAGLSVTDSLAGARGVLQLSAAAQIGIADATELAASALNAFQLSGAEAVHVADLLANSANNAQGSISDMGLALRQVAAVGQLVGLSLEDTTTLITILAQRGLRGSDAGTSLRVSLLRLINPTKAAQKALEGLNVELRDAEGNLRPEVFADIDTALQDFTKAQQQATRAVIFGADGIRAATLAGEAGVSGFNAMADALEREGAAAELAAARSQGFAGQMSALQSNIETFGTTLGTIVLPPLTGFVGILNNIISFASGAAGAIGQITGTLSELNTEAKEAVPVLEQVENRLKAIIRDQITSAVLGGPNVGARAVLFAASQLREGSDEIELSAREITKNIDGILESLQGPIGPTQLNQAILQLQEMADKLAAGDANARSAGREIRELIKEIQALGGLPASIVEIQARLDKAGAEREAREGGNIILGALQDTLGPAGAQALGFDFIENVGKGMKDAAPIAGGEAGTILVQSLSTQLAVAQATGSESQVLSILREREKRQADFLQRILERPQDAQTQALVRRAAANLQSTQDEIQSILDKQAADAKASQDAIIAARNKADQALLGSINLEEQRRNNALLKAQSTDSLKDDIQRGVALRNFYKRAIEEVQKTVKDATVAAQTIASLVAKKIAADRQIADAQEQMKEARRQQRQEERARIRENLALDVEIAQATGNKSKEIRAREAEINRIQEEIRQTRAGSLQRKRLILELRQKQAELRELKDEAEETNESASQFFKFLQSQQGFAANLLGNLFPTSAVSGLVGGSQAQAQPVTLKTPTQAVTAQAGAKQQLGPTFGQMATEVDILKQIHKVLVDILGGTAHPEVDRNRKIMNSAMDTFVGGV